MAITTVEEVRHAGNFSQKVSGATLQFYLDFTSFYLEAMVGSTIYAAAKTGSLTPAANNVKLRIAEALMTVSYALPTVGIAVTEAGMLRIQTVGGRGGELETVSFAREISELAAHFARLAFVVIPEAYVEDENFKEVWFNVVGRVFPGLDEMPTMATIHSEAEALIKDERGDETFDPTKTG